MNRAVDDTFDEVKGSYLKAVCSFRRRYGGDPEDLLSLAGQLFMKAYDSYCPERGEFGAWVAVVVRQGLRDAHVKEAHRRRLLRRVGEGELHKAHARRCWTLEVFTDEMTPDAVTAVMIAVDWCDCGETHHANRCRVVKILRKRGWDDERINRTFNEVGDNL